MSNQAIITKEPWFPIIYSQEDSTTRNRRWLEVRGNKFLKRSPPYSLEDPEEASNNKYHLDIKPSPKHLSAARIFPNGEFGVGRVPAEKKRAVDRRFGDGCVGDYGTELVPTKHETEDSEVYYDITDKYTASYKLGNPHESSQKTKKYGLKGITSYGRKVVRNIAYLFQESDEPEKLCMGTLTIPNFSEDAERKICSKWAYLTSRFFQAVKRRYAKFNRQFHYVSVTEIQPKRWAESHQVGLHLHFLYRAYYDNRSGRYLLDANWVRSTWRRLLYNLLEGSQPVENPNYRFDKVKTSAAAYMGKYMSKGGNICEEVLEIKGEEYLPSQWWSADLESKRLLKSKIIVCRGKAASALLDLCRHESDKDFFYCFPVIIETPACGARIVGYHGRLTKEAQSAIERIFYKEKLQKRGLGVDILAETS